MNLGTKVFIFTVPALQSLQHKKISNSQSFGSIVYLFTFYPALLLVEQQFITAEHFLHCERKQ